MEEQKQPVLFITDKKFVDYTIAGGVQLCTAEFISYLTQAGYLVNIFKAEPLITTAKKIKLKIGIEAYELYNIDSQLAGIIKTINTEKIKLVFFNQLNLAPNLVKIKGKVPADVKFIGLSHGNESGDYLHQITQHDNPSFINTWRLGKLIAKEKLLFSKLLDGVITISTHEAYINQWLGANNVLFLPRILKPGFIDWKPDAKTVGFAGTLDHLPNLSGILLLSEQLKLKGFKGIIRLVGGPEKLGKELEAKYDFIHYCGQLNSQQLIAEVSTWAVFINPIFWYARGSSTKLAQALNWGIPVLTTPAGARGYELCNPGIVSNNNLPETFAGMVLEAIASAAFVRELKQASADNINNFNLGPLTNKLRVYLDAIAGPL